MLNNQVEIKLYFGLSIPNGPCVTQEDFQDFLNESIVSRFPDGFSVSSNQGYWKGTGTGGTIMEASITVTIVADYSQGTKARIESLQSIYKSRFNKQAVLVTVQRLEFVSL